MTHFLRLICRIDLRLTIRRDVATDERRYDGGQRDGRYDDAFDGTTGTAAVAEEADRGSKLWSIICQIQSSLLYVTHS